jgi:hypothetical protein
MSSAILAAGLVGQQQHEPPAGAHLVLLAGAVVTAIVILGVRWWRGRHDGGAPDRESTPHDRSAERTPPTEDE